MMVWFLVVRMILVVKGNHLDIKHQCLEKPVAERFNCTGYSLDNLSVFMKSIYMCVHRDEAKFCSAKKLMDLDSPNTGPRGTESQTVGLTSCSDTETQL